MPQTDNQPTLMLPAGERVPAMGQGTWYLGDDANRRREEIRALQAGIDHGLSLIDTAEMYGSGRSESLVGEAIAGRRDEVFLVSKVLPSNAGTSQAIAACEASLKRLGTDRLDMYLLHWEGSVPFEDTIAAFEQLQATGKIRHFGVSNLDLAASQAFQAASASSGVGMQTNQLLYNLDQRGVEWDLLAWLGQQGIITMAYSPFDGGQLIANPALIEFAGERDMTAGQAALAWLLHQDSVLPIPKSGTPARVIENAGALQVTLGAADLAQLDELFRPPSAAEPLQIY